jgi:hypothetical protein
MLLEVYQLHHSQAIQYSIDFCGANPAGGSDC